MSAADGERALVTKLNSYVNAVKDPTLCTWKMVTGDHPTFGEKMISATWGDVASSANTNGHTDYVLDDENTYTIYNAVGLAWLAQQVNSGNSFEGKTIKLANDIKLDIGLVSGYEYSGLELGFTATVTAENSWIPIGTMDESLNALPFKGTFDGGNNTISRIFIRRNADYQGLFGINGGVIKNLKTADQYIYSDGNYIGGFAGYNDGGTIDNCSTAFYFKGSGNNIGAIAGQNNAGIIKNCSVLNGT